MSQKSAAAVQPAKQDPTLKALPPSSLFDRIQDTYHAIAHRAFEAFERRGRTDGNDLDDWFTAEAELLHPLHLAVAESDEAVTIRAEVPGFRAKELEIGIEPHRLVIIGKREASEERRTKKTIRWEHCSNQVFRYIDLPADVDSSKVTSTLQDGVLELVMPKVGKASDNGIRS